MATTYDLRVSIIEALDNPGEACDYCQTEGQDVQAQVYMHVGEGEQTYTECCLACLVPTIDATPYLDTERTILVEVPRSATLRPF